MDLDLFQTDNIAPPKDEPHTITCHCPKCSASIDLELNEVLSDSAGVRSCPACKAKYVLTRESFACRASRKTGAINCAICGNVLSHSQYCPSCTTLYPDYFVAEPPDAAKKRAKQNIDHFAWLKNISFEWRSSPSISSGYTPTLEDTEVWREHEPSGLKKKSVMVAATAVIVIALIAGGTGIYYQNKAKNQYISTYIMALYGIKVGSDLGLTLSKQLATNWNTRIAAGQNSPARITVDEENQLNNIKSKTDAYLKKLSNPPSSYADANEKLLQLNTTYGKLHASAQNPAGSIASFVESTQKTEVEFQAGIANLKKSLPPELAKELNVAKAKYSALGSI